VLLLQLPQSLHVRLGHRGVLALPRVVRRLAHAVLAAQLLDALLPDLALTQNRHNLFLGESLLHLGPFRAAILYHRVETFSGDRTSPCHEAGCSSIRYRPAADHSRGGCAT